MGKTYAEKSKPSIQCILDSILFLEQETCRLGLMEISTLLKSTYLEIDMLHNADRHFHTQSEDIHVAAAMLRNIEKSVNVIMHRFNIENTKAKTKIV